MRNKTNLLLSIGIIVLFILSINYCSDFECKRDLSLIKKNQTLHVVVSKDTSEYFKSKDSISGFQYEVLKEFADKQGLHLVIVTESSLKKSIDGLKKGKFDIVAQNILVTTDLREKVNFTRPIMYNKQVLVQKKTNGELIKNHFDLFGKTIHVKRNSTGVTRLKNLAHEMGDTINVVELKERNATIIKLVNEGKIQYAVCDQRIARINQTDSLDIKMAIGFTQIEAWAIRKKSPELEKELNKFLDSFVDSEQYWKLYKKYYTKKD